MKQDPTALIEALSDPSAYPSKPESVTVIQTHISIVFIADNHVFKIKKALDLGFLDFTSLEKRLYYCQREVELNSRFSRNIYLGVVPICEQNGNLSFIPGGTEVEYAVHMTKIPTQLLLSQKLSDEKVNRTIINKIARKIAQVHFEAAAGPHIMTFGSPEVIYHNLRENFEQTRKFVGLTISSSSHQEITERSLEFLQQNKNFFLQRMNSGYIRDCHGDLHTEHVLLSTEIMLIDCIEFNNRFRYSDTASDLAFLLMDLDYHGFPYFSEILRSRYIRVSSVRDCKQLYNFYKSYRAFVRGKVNSFITEEPEVPADEKDRAILRARDYFRLAAAYLRPPKKPTLIIMHGYTGSGKSHTSGRLAKRLGYDRFLSDVVRKELYNFNITEHYIDKFGEGIYTSKSTDDTYDALFERAARNLARGKSVILDASFGKEKHRFKAQLVAEMHNARFMIVSCAAPYETVRERLFRRAQHGKGVSDGTWDIYLKQLETFDPFSKREEGFLRIIDTSRDKREFLRAVVIDILADS